MINIAPLSVDQWDGVVDIFFESSPKKIFKSSEEKNDFIYKYLGFYRQYFQDFFLVATLDTKVIGYICGSPSSLDQNDLYSSLSHYSLFEDLYHKFPAHLHINLSSDSRGHGIGSRLIETFESLCSDGVHLLTTPNSKNRSFYLKNGYSLECIREFNGLELLFMGKIL